MSRGYDVHPDTSCCSGQGRHGYRTPLVGALIKSVASEEVLTCNHRLVSCVQGLVGLVDSNFISQTDRWMQTSSVELLYNIRLFPISQSMSYFLVSGYFQLPECANSSSQAKII